MIIEQFINEKVTQISAYTNAVIGKTIHYTELDRFVVDTMEEWTLLQVIDETPSSAKERVFWHIIHLLCLHGAQGLKHNLFLKVEIKTCIDFVNGIGSYPIDCVGWRPIP
ncbi:hypothetical protein ACOYR1_13585 [Thalassotalea piscium]